jgi:hypothetical protein
MNDELAEKFVAILDRYEAREIDAEEALIEIQIAVANDNETEAQNKIELSR